MKWDLRIHLSGAVRRKAGLKQRIFPLLSGIGAIDAVFPSVRFTRMISFCKATTTVLSVSGTTVETMRSNCHERQFCKSGIYSYNVFPSISTQKSVLRSGCQIDPSPVVASARNARSGLIIIGSFIQEVPSNMINANMNLLTIFFMVCYESEFTKV